MSRLAARDAQASSGEPTPPSNASQFVGEAWEAPQRSACGLTDVAINKPNPITFTKSTLERMFGWRHGADRTIRPTAVFQYIPAGSTMAKVHPAQLTAPSRHDAEPIDRQQSGSGRRKKVDGYSLPIPLVRLLFQELQAKPGHKLRFVSQGWNDKKQLQMNVSLVPADQAVCAEDPATFKQQMLGSMQQAQEVQQDLPLPLGPMPAAAESVTGQLAHADKAGQVAAKPAALVSPARLVAAALTAVPRNTEQPACASAAGGLPTTQQSVAEQSAMPPAAGGADSARLAAAPSVAAAAVVGKASEVMPPREGSASEREQHAAGHAPATVEGQATGGSTAVTSTQRSAGSLSPAGQGDGKGYSSAAGQDASSGHGLANTTDEDEPQQPRPLTRAQQPTPGDSGLQRLVAAAVQEAPESADKEPGKQLPLVAHLDSFTPVVQQVILAGMEGWLSTEQILCLMNGYMDSERKGFALAKNPPQEPQAGAMYLANYVDRLDLKDGGKWRDRRSMELRVKGVNVLKVVYHYNEDRNFARRSYRLADESSPLAHLHLLHYQLPEGMLAEKHASAPRPNKRKQLSPAGKWQGASKRHAAGASVHASPVSFPQVTVQQQGTAQLDSPASQPQLPVDESSRQAAALTKRFSGEGVERLQGSPSFAVPQRHQQPDAAQQHLEMPQQGGTSCFASQEADRQQHWAEERQQQRQVDGQDNWHAKTGEEARRQSLPEEQPPRQQEGNKRCSMSEQSERRQSLLEEQPLRQQARESQGKQSESVRQLGARPQPQQQQQGQAEQHSQGQEDGKDSLAKPPPLQQVAGRQRLQQALPEAAHRQDGDEQQQQQRQHDGTTLTHKRGLEEFEGEEQQAAKRQAVKQPGAQGPVASQQPGAAKGAEAATEASAATAAAVGGPTSLPAAVHAKAEHTVGYVKTEHTAGSVAPTAGLAASNPAARAEREADDSSGTNRRAVFQALVPMLLDAGVESGDALLFLRRCIRENKDTEDVGMHWGYLSQTYRKGQHQAVRDWVAKELAELAKSTS